MRDPEHFLVSGHFIKYPGHTHAWNSMLCSVENNDATEIIPYDSGIESDDYKNFKSQVQCEKCMVRGAVMRANNLPTTLEGIRKLLQLVNVKENDNGTADAK